MLPERIVDTVVGIEEALDRLKLSYKERFNRFSPARVVPYRGYGRKDTLILRGRVLEDEETGFDPEPGLWTNVRNTIHRLESDEIRGARVRGSLGDCELEAIADDEAFFEFRFRPDQPVSAGWHRVRLEIVEAMAEDGAGPVSGEVLVPPDDCDFVVVSDLDDTVLRTGATSHFGMLQTVLLNDARTRMPFQGVASFYRALEAGPSQEKRNPFFYLSRSAWNLHEMVIGFLEHHRLPKGPVLLRDYGLREILSDDEEAYKRRNLIHLLDFYPDHQFLLFGDSGQRDPEIYHRIARERPDRIRAVFIRDVTSPERDREVHRLADSLQETGVPMILATDSEQAALEAANLGLLSPERLPGIEAERRSEVPARSVRALLFG